MQLCRIDAAHFCADIAYRRMALPDREPGSEQCDDAHDRSGQPQCLLKAVDDAQIVRLYDAKRTFFGMGRFDSADGMLKPIKIFSGGMDELC